MTTDFRPSPLMLTDEDLCILLNQIPRDAVARANWVRDICDNGRNFDPCWFHGEARCYVTLVVEAMTANAA